MANPQAEFIALMEGADLPDDVQLYAAPDTNITVPAIVLRPNTPWLQPDRFCHDLERYAAVCVVQAATPEDGIPLLRTMSLAIIAALVPPWDWESVDGPVIDETTGIAFLANRLHLKYSNGGND